MNPGSMSVARTLPAGPTRSASHRAILPLPALTFQHAHPSVTPMPVRYRMVEGSNVASNPEKRRPAWAVTALSNTYRFSAMASPSRRWHLAYQRNLVD